MSFFVLLIILCFKLFCFGINLKFMFSLFEESFFIIIFCKENESRISLSSFDPTSNNFKVICFLLAQIKRTVEKEGEKRRFSLAIGNSIAKILNFYWKERGWTSSFPSKMVKWKVEQQRVALAPPFLPFPLHFLQIQPSYPYLAFPVAKARLLPSNCTRNPAATTDSNRSFDSSPF